MTAPKETIVLALRALARSTELAHVTDESILRFLHGAGLANDPNAGAEEEKPAKRRRTSPSDATSNSNGSSSELLHGASARAGAEQPALLEAKLELESAQSAAREEALATIAQEAKS